jgi:hypothetical protein
MDAPLKLAIIQNEISRGKFAANIEVPVELNDQGQALSLIQGQCNQLLQDKIKQDIYWNTVSTSYDPLKLYLLIERTVLAQTEDQYPFATVYDQ